MWDLEFGQLVEVRWGDAWSNLRHYNEEGDYTPLKCKSVGYFMEENAETMVLCTMEEIGGTLSYRDSHVMPLSWITDVWVVT